MFRAILTFLAVCALSLTPVATLAQPMRGEGVAVVLCAEAGAVTVVIGPDGQPEPARAPACRHCPDCLPQPQPVAGHFPPPAPERGAEFVRLGRSLPRAQPVPGRAAQPFPARGPPRVI